MLSEAPETAESVGSVGYSGGYFVHRQREIRGQRGSSKGGRMERARLRLRSCMFSSFVLMTGSGHSSPVYRKAETRAGKARMVGGTARGG